MLITVIVPCYNYGHFLEETLRSVKSQSCTSWECIIVDDGSTDNTADIVYTFCKNDKRFRYIYQENRGLSAARNKGLELAKGDYIQLLDADDLIEPEKLKVHSEFLSNNPDVDIVYGSMRRFLTENPEKLFFVNVENDYNWMPEISGKGERMKQALIKSNIMVVSSPLIKKEVFNVVGNFNENLKSVEDWELWIRCALMDLKFEFLNNHNTLTLIRTHEKNMMKNNLVMFKSQIMMRRNIRKFINEKNTKQINKFELNKLLGEVGIFYIKQKKIVKGFFFIFSMRNKMFWEYLRHVFFWLRKTNKNT